jgi:hypothetical protein
MIKGYFATGDNEEFSDIYDFEDIESFIAYVQYLSTKEDNEVWYLADSTFTKIFIVQDIKTVVAILRYCLFNSKEIDVTTFESYEDAYEYSIRSNGSNPLIKVDWMEDPLSYFSDN